jgi:hypothetical protein
MTGTPRSIAMWTVLNQGLHALLPGLVSQRVTSSPTKAIHLVLVGPATRTAVNKTDPRAILGSKILRSFIDTMISCTFKGLIWSTNLHRVRGCSDRIRQTDDKQILLEIRLVGVVKRPSRVDKVQLPVQFKHSAIDSPLILFHASDRTHELPRPSSGVLVCWRSGEDEHSVRLVSMFGVASGVVYIPSTPQAMEFGCPEVV